MKTIAVLGSTGSIGRQTLEIAEHLGMKVIALTAYNNEKLLQEQTEKFKPERSILGSRPGADKEIEETAQKSGADIIVTAIAGEAGVAPTIAAAKTGKRIALACKEALVCAGDTVMQTARGHGTEIIPVDSEHSAIFQCLAETRCGDAADRANNADTHYTAATGDTEAQGSISKRIKKIILTASGGPFRGMSRQQLRDVTPEQALKHPNWDMGKKVTIDSATMMNKGLEFIEAMHLFGVPPEQIEVVIHPESIIHSMVEFTDGSVIAQMSNPDMRMPIQYALTYPARAAGITKPLDLTQLGSLTFEKPDTENFPCLRLAVEAAKKGTEACRVLNNTNEKAVNLFLSGEIAFTEIPDMIEEALNK